MALNDLQWYVMLKLGQKHNEIILKADLKKMLFYCHPTNPTQNYSLSERK